MNINLHIWLTLVLGVSSPHSASIVSAVATVAKEDDGGTLVSSYNHRHHLNLRSNSHYDANTRTSTTTSDVLSKGHNLRRLQEEEQVLELINTTPTSPLRQLQGGLTCDANSNNAGTVCTKDQDCPVSS